MHQIADLSNSLVLSMLFGACLFVTMILILILISFSNTKNDDNGMLVFSYAQGQNAAGLMLNNRTNAANIKPAENNTTATATATMTNQIHGTLIVTKNIVDQSGVGKNNNASDFIITVHGNNPSPSSFRGNSSGTSVRLQMGMYSVTEKGPSGYNSSMTGDCSGGMMSIETKKCTITNTYTAKKSAIIV
jgi:hypothetical protein